MKYEHTITEVEVIVDGKRYSLGKFDPLVNGQVVILRGDPPSKDEVDRLAKALRDAGAKHVVFLSQSVGIAVPPAIDLVEELLSLGALSVDDLTRIVQRALQRALRQNRPEAKAEGDLSTQASDEA